MVLSNSNLERVRTPVILQISLAPPDIDHAIYLLRHQMRQLGGQVQEVLFTVDLRRGPGRSAVEWDRSSSRLVSFLDPRLAEWPNTRWTAIDYRKRQASRLASELFEGRPVPAKDFRGGPPRPDGRLIGQVAELEEGTSSLTYRLVDFTTRVFLLDRRLLVSRVGPLALASEERKVARKCGRRLQDGMRRKGDSKMPATLTLTREQNRPIELRRGRFEVSVDGKPIGSLENHETFQAQIPPGHHALQLHKGRYRSKEVTFEVPDGDTISFRCHGARFWPTWLLSYAVPSVAISVSQG